MTKILVVDDDGLVAALLSSTLEELGYEVCEAYCGADAIELVATDRRIAVVVTDLGMPGISGYQLAETVRALRPGMPVILATGDHRALRDASHGLPVLPKPYSRKELGELVGHVTRDLAECV